MPTPIHTSQEHIEDQDQKIQTLESLIAHRSQTHLPQVMNEWTNEYQSLKMDYLMKHCNMREEIGHSDYHKFSSLFSKPTVENKKFKFNDDYGLSRLDQIEVFKRSLKDQNKNLVKFSHSPNGQSYCFEQKKFVLDDQIEIHAYEFASLEDYICSCVTRYRKELSSLRAVRTKMVKQLAINNLKKVSSRVA